MTRTTRIPPDEFATALGRLDPDEFASFVGEVWLATADEVEVDPPAVTVRKGPERLRLLAVTGQELPETVDGFDAVVTAGEGPDPDFPSFGPPEIRQRLLYGLGPEEAEDICERFLGAPARSPSYAPAGGSADSDDGREQEAGSTDRDLAPRTGTRLDDLADRVGPQVALVGLLALVVLAGSGTAVLVGGLVPDDAADTSGGEESGLAVSDAHVSTGEREWGGWQAIPEGMPTATPTPTSREAGTATPASGDRSSNAIDWGQLGADRYADLRPTCNRSYLHVVQIQMNALKYNDNGTDDGIRTVRRFASPQNRETVGSFEQFVRVVESPTYAPMLSYDSVEYTPRRVGEDSARVRVVTRADGNLTGRYMFRLRRIDGGEFDGCWMTDGVQSLKTSVATDVE